MKAHVAANRQMVMEVRCLIPISNSLVVQRLPEVVANVPRAVFELAASKVDDLAPIAAGSTLSLKLDLFVQEMDCLMLEAFWGPMNLGKACLVTAQPEQDVNEPMVDVFSEEFAANHQASEPHVIDLLSRASPRSDVA